MTDETQKKRGMGNNGYIDLGIATIQKYLKNGEAPLNRSAALLRALGEGGKKVLRHNRSYHLSLFQNHYN